MGTNVKAIMVGVIFIIMLAILIIDPMADAQNDRDMMMGDRNNMSMEKGMMGSSMNAAMDENMMGMRKEILEELKIAVCVMEPTEGNKSKGIVKFWQDGEEVVVMAEIEGLEPNTEHGFHIHEYGDISSPKGLATGEHYNPEMKPHGLPWNPNRHAGDLGNILADGHGNAKLMLRVKNISIGKMLNPIIGRGMIIHESNDKNTQPVGDAGARIAQGVIGVGDPKDVGSMPNFAGMGMINGMPIKSMQMEGYMLEDVKQ